MCAAREFLMNKSLKRLALVFMLALAGVWFAGDARAEIKTKIITYKDGDLTLKGLMAWDGAMSGKRPGILVIGEWWGVNEANMNRARRMAAEGYVAFAPDMYGDGKVTNDKKQAGKWMHQVIDNTDILNRRAQLGLDILKADPNVDGGKLAAMGSSFGGLTALEMAYADQDIKAAVSIASSLPLVPKGVTSIKPRVLAFLGGDDTFVKPERIVDFKASLKRTKADWEMIIYSGARHSFATPGSGSYGIKNMAYNEMADKRSWVAMMTLFDEVFK